MADTALDPELARAVEGIEQDVLGVIAPDQELTMSAVAAKLEAPAATVGAAIQRLEQRGLLVARWVQPRAGKRRRERRFGLGPEGKMARKVVLDTRRFTKR